MLAVRRVAVMQRGQVLADAEPRAERERRTPLFPGGIEIAELRVATGQARAVHGVGRADAAERLDRLAVAARSEAGPCQVAPEALRVIRVEAHRLPDPLD